MEFSLLGFPWTVIRFNSISVRIDDEGRVVVGTVLGPQARRAIVMPASEQRCRVKCVDSIYARRIETEMQTRLWIERDRMLGQVLTLLDKRVRDAAAAAGAVRPSNVLLSSSRMALS